ncbi:CaiF/GrlA family transcriptional regulator [Aeromonas dhakensis]|uniref:CaiF/GrlA family transcriptional regulator n=1 Tax=Aeromonas dhakensis TaxID=196024 RepID=UPI0039B74B73
MPRYLRVAHWLLEQQRPISSREVADAFRVSPKAISDDFAKIRRRTDIIDVYEQKVRSKGVQQYLLHVLNIYPYMLDERQCPHRKEVDIGVLRTTLTWHDLICRPWRQLIELQLDRQ